MKKSPLPITKKQLYRIALGTHIRKGLLFCAPISLVLLIVSIGGRMSTTSAAASILFICFFASVYILPQLRTQYVSLASLRSIPDFDLLLKGKQLYWLNGAWGYADEEWFIRASPVHCAILHASEINFKIPIRKSSYTWAAKHGRFGTYHCTVCQLLFTSQNGKPIITISEDDSNITNWIHRRGGKINL